MFNIITNIISYDYFLFFRTFRFHMALIAKAGRNAKRIPINSGTSFPFMAFTYIKTINKTIETNTINTVAIVFLFFVNTFFY